MKKILFVLLGLFIVVPGFSANGRNAGGPDVGLSRSMIKVAPAGNKSSLKWDGEPVINAVGVVPVAAENESPQPDNRDAERTACISNNGWGMGNTFVWASRDSNVNDYSTMVEDTENPENNVCWVRVDMRSNDNRVDVSDFGGRYFEMGTTITCGDWVDTEVLEKRILDAKKTARTLATVGGAVGGAGIGVGAMELFGNRALSNVNRLEGLQGQKALNADDTLLSVLRELGSEDVQYKNIVGVMKKLRSLCGSGTGNTCNMKKSWVDFNYILNELGEKN